MPSNGGAVIVVQGELTADGLAALGDALREREGPGMTQKGKYFNVAILIGALDVPDVST